MVAWGEASEPQERGHPPNLSPGGAAHGRVRTFRTDVAPAGLSVLKGLGADWPYAIGLKAPHSPKYGAFQEYVACVLVGRYFSHTKLDLVSTRYGFNNSVLSESHFVCDSPYAMLKY